MILSMMLSPGELGQRKTTMPAIVAGLPGKSIRTESPRVLDKRRSRPDREFT
jgi:hypothetical protein